MSTLEVDRLRDDLHTICGAFWRLDKYGFVTTLNLNADDELNEQAEHWIVLARGIVEKYRATLKVKP